MTEWKPYLIALAVGLLVGIERESSKADRKALGVRTFLLLSLLGCISGGLENPWQSLMITGLVIGLILTSYVIQIFSKPLEVHLGLTTEIAGGIVYLAGYLASSSPVLAATIGPVVAIILFSKLTLHRFTHAIKPIELKTAIIILLITAVVIDLIPDAVIDPWGFFNPRKFGYLILTLACLEFLSYISFKVIGEKKSSLVVGLLGGIVSSTVVLISSAHQVRKDETSWRVMAYTTIAAQIASLAELIFIIFLISPTLVIQIAYITIPIMIFGAGALYFINRKIVKLNSDVELKSPLDWKGVFRLSIIFTFLLALTSVAQHWLGKEATLALSFLTGLFELQGISLANATLFSQKQVSIDAAVQCIAAAITASLISKIVMSWFFGRNKFAVCLTVVFVPMICMVAAISLWIFSLN